MSNSKLESWAIDGSKFFKKQSHKAKEALKNSDSRNMEVAWAIFNYIEDTPGMSRSILAEQLGVSQAYLCKLINGQINLSLNTIEKYEDALGIRLLPGRQNKLLGNEFVICIPSEKVYASEAFSFDSLYMESTFKASRHGNKVQICCY